MLSRLQKFIQSGVQRLSSLDSSSSANSSSFHAYLSSQLQAEPQQPCPHRAFELEEVLLQVFKHLDSRTLCTSVPLVCQNWRAAASSEQIWAPRCDPHLLLALSQQHTPAPAGGGEARAPCQHSSGSCRASTAPGLPQHVPLPLLHHAVYSLNLLRNPQFHAAANGDFSTVLQQRWARMAPARGHRPTAAVLTSEQRKLAWVTTVGRPRWAVDPATGPAEQATGMQPPTPLRYPLSPASSTGLHSQLQGWLFGRNSSSSTALVQAAASSSAGGNAGAAGQQPAEQQQPQQQQQQLSYLETGSSWAEVVQVIDLLGELTARGLDPATAAAVLDSDALCVALSFWVAAAAPLDSTSSEVRCSSEGSSAVPNSAGLDNAASGAEDSSTHSGSSSSSSSTPSAHMSANGDCAGGGGCDGGAAQAAPALQAADADAAQLLAPTQLHTSQPRRPQVQPPSVLPVAGTSHSHSHSHSRSQQSPAQFAAALMLDDGQVPLRSFQTFVVTDSSHHFFSKRLAVEPGEPWRRYAYVVPSCPKGLRRAVVLLRGRGTGPGSSSAAAAAAAAAAASSRSGSGSSSRSSSGGGGVRFACAQLCFIPRHQVEGFGAAECLSSWQDRVVQGF